jgi:tetratricopeptide (TPR) repeat protein
MADLPMGRAVLAGLLLAALTAVILAQARRRPWLCAGWLWYLGMLAPMIGIVQFGTHAMADRFAYLPSIGVFLAVVWLTPVLPGLRRLGPALIGVAAGTAILACSAATAVQLGHWRTSETLMLRALAVTEGNFIAHNNLGTAMAREGRGDEAIAHFAAAVRLRPEWGRPRVNLGEALLKRGEPAEALRQFQTALVLMPEEPAVHDFLGQALVALGRPREAAARYAAALRLQPGYAGTRERLRRAEAAAAAGR